MDAICFKRVSLRVSRRIVKILKIYCTKGEEINDKVL